MHFRRAASKTDTAGNQVLRSQLLQENGGSKSKGRKHGFVSVWNGWLLILCVIFITAVVAYFNFQSERNSASAKGGENRSPTTLVQSSSGSRIGHNPIEIPDCESSPWKPDEDLVGICPGRKAHDLSIQSAMECSKACCADPNCIVWQLRGDRGCLHGGDVRIGQEKDGPAAYCSDHPPLRWQGQMLKGRKDTECTDDAWHPDEQPGQCFGLGDVRPGIETAQECKAACCSIDICAAWQFQETLGCFYNVRMHSCQKGDDPVFFEPFVGRRKKLSSRTYKGRNGKASVSWKQKGNPTS